MTQIENPRVVSADVMIADELFYELLGLESQPASVVESQTEVTVDPRNLKLEDEYSKSRIDSYRDLVVNLTKEEVGGKTFHISIVFICILTIRAPFTSSVGHDHITQS